MSAVLLGAGLTGWVVPDEWRLPLIVGGVIAGAIAVWTVSESRKAATKPEPKINVKVDGSSNTTNTAGRDQTVITNIPSAPQAVGHGSRRRALRLHLTDLQRARLRKHTGFELRVMPLHDDPEASEFADALMELVRSAGWLVPDVREWIDRPKRMGVVLTYGPEGAAGLHPAQEELRAVLQELGYDVQAVRDHGAYVLEVGINA